MFQTFDVTSDPGQGPPRLKRLREAMSGAGLDGWLVPRADIFQGEYVAPSDERLAWLTGFTGSAGFAAVLSEAAGLFVDGRYTVQARAQTAAEAYTIVNSPRTKLSDWLRAQLPDGGKVGYDPLLHTVHQIEHLVDDLTRHGIELVARDNLIDAIWPDRPAPPEGAFSAYPVERAGRTSAQKRADIAEELRAADQAAVLLTQPDSIAWLLNIRGSDIPRNPVPHGFVILHADASAALYARPGKADALGGHIGPEVSLHDDATLLDDLAELDGPVRVDPASCPVRFAEALSAAGVALAQDKDPCLLPKAIKTDEELRGTREAHLRDGAAMARFLAWLAAEAPKGALSEIDVATALEGFRRDTGALLDISFETISGAGPNAALPHYRVSTASNRRLNAGEVILVDSGGQYIDGTTDVTRTMAVGDVPDEVREAYTRVLQGMIALSRTRFPTGVAGAHLDAIARRPLWQAGKDYDHGTGHGVGVYLSVHEGPHGLSRRTNVPLQPGMILSNEPGYYAEGSFGIRIENLIVVREAPSLPGADDRPWRDFETITWVPFDRAMIEPGLLQDDERRWIDAYHARTRDLIGPRLDASDRAWLDAACAPL